MWSVRQVKTQTNPELTFAMLKPASAALPITCFEDEIRRILFGGKSNLKQTTSINEALSSSVHTQVC